MAAGNYRKECHYPDLYDDSIKQCNKFEMVNCDKKPEPQAPCKFEIYSLLPKLYISSCNVKNPKTTAKLSKKKRAETNVVLIVLMVSSVTSALLLLPLLNMKQVPEKPCLSQ